MHHFGKYLGAREIMLDFTTTFLSRAHLLQLGLRDAVNLFGADLLQFGLRLDDAEKFFNFHHGHERLQVLV